jgi:hypothetical protein
MSNSHFDSVGYGHVNIHGLRGTTPVLIEHHAGLVHADYLDNGQSFFIPGPGPRVVELVGLRFPVYCRDSSKIRTRMGHGQALFWLSGRAMLHLSRRFRTWFTSPPPDAELVPVEIQVIAWLNSPDHRQLTGINAALDARYARALQQPVGNTEQRPPGQREASDFIPYELDSYAEGRRRYRPSSDRQGGDPDD